MQGDQSIASVYEQELGFAIKLKFSIINHDKCHEDQAPEYIFDERGGVIGRGSNCDWVMKCNGLSTSRRHASIKHEDGQYSIKDISSNGVILNQDYLEQGEYTVLSRGDIIEFGDYVIRVDMFAGEALEIVPPKKSDLSNLSNEEILATDNIKVVEPTLNIPRQSAELGSPGDDFHPPGSIIPDNWDTEEDLDLNVKAQSITPSDVTEKPFTNVFSRDDDLLKALFEGMGVEVNSTGNELTPEQMKMLGQSINLLFKGFAGLNKAQRKTKNKFLNKDLAYLDNNGDDTATIQHIASEMMTGSKQSRNKQLHKLKEDVSGLIQHQAMMNDCLDRVGHIVGKQFDPQRIENAFEKFKEQQYKNAPLKRMLSWIGLKTLYGKFFDNYFRVRSHEVQKKIKNIFSQRLLQQHANRLREQNNRY